MKKRRVFIAIRPSQKARDRLFSFSRKWQEIPCRWIKPENIHFTLIPPMYLDENELSELISSIKAKSPDWTPFYLKLKKIAYGPFGKPSRMVWAVGEPNKELIELKNAVEEAIFDAKIPFREETRPFKYPHLTLARMYQEEWREYEPKPKIDEPLNLEIPVESIEIMESELKRGGAEYTALDSIPLEK